jgi:protein-tyrosine kinase
MAVELPEHYVELERVYARTIGDGVRSLAVTSADEGEGVTTLVVALAKRSRHSGRSTLAVDLNLYRPALAERFGVTQIPRVADGRHGQDALPRVNLGDGLTLIPAPTDRGEAIRLRDRHRFDEYLDAWLGQFDTVIFDTTSLNGSNKGNIPAEQVCQGCAGAVLVVLAGITPASALRAALDKLGAAEANLLGTVLNDRHNPSLAEELRRETERFERRLPGLAQRVRGRIRASKLLSLET